MRSPGRRANERCGDDPLVAVKPGRRRLIDERPRTGIRGSRIAFLHPASTGGVLTEIVQPAEGRSRLTKQPPRGQHRLHRRQVLAARVAPAELTRLRQALPAAGWHDLGAEDGTVALELSKVVYVLLDHEEQRVGFGT